MHGSLAGSGATYGVHVLDVAKNEWVATQVRSLYQQIPERTGHSAVLVSLPTGGNNGGTAVAAAAAAVASPSVSSNSRIAVFGGRLGTSLFTDVFYLSLSCDDDGSVVSGSGGGSSGQCRLFWEPAATVVADDSSLPAGRYNHAGVWAQGRMYVLGGGGASFRTLPAADMLVVQPCPSQCSGHGSCNATRLRCQCEPGYKGVDCSQHHMAWSVPDTHGDRPPALFRPSLTAVPSGDGGAGMLVLFGGMEGETGKYSNDLRTLTLSDMRWTLLPAGPSTPSPRASHSAALHSDGRSLYLFGGCSGCHEGTEGFPLLLHGAGPPLYHADLFVLDVVTLTWRRVSDVTGAAPPTACAGHTMVLAGAGVFVMYGGMSGPLESDIRGTAMALHAPSSHGQQAQTRHRWEVLTTDTTVAPARFGHTANWVPLPANATAASPSSSSSSSVSVGAADGRLVVSSGFVFNPASSSKRHARVHQLDVLSRGSAWARVGSGAWKQHAIAKVSSRYFHTSVDFGRHSPVRGAVVFGGRCNGPVHRDLYVLHYGGDRDGDRANSGSAAALYYSRVSAAGVAPGKRFGHAAARVGSAMYMVGGWDAEQRYYSGVQKLETVACPAMCSGHGSCATGVCSCRHPYLGAACDVRAVVRTVRQVAPPVLAAVLAAACVGLLLLAALGALLWRCRHLKVVQFATRPFILLFLAFAALGCASAPLYVLSPHAHPEVCALRPLLSALAASGMLGNLFVKTYRVHLLVNNTKMRRRRYGTAFHSRGVAAFLLANALLLLLWYTVAGVPQPRVRTVPSLSSPFLSVQAAQCSSSPPFVWLLLAVNGAGLLTASYLAFRVRDAPSECNESTHVGIAAFLMLFIALLLVPLNSLLSAGGSGGDAAASVSASGSDPTAVALLRGLGSVLLSVALTATIFAPKLLLIVTGRGNDVAERHGGAYGMTGHHGRTQQHGAATSGAAGRSGRVHQRSMLGSREAWGAGTTTPPPPAVGGPPSACSAAEHGPAAAFAALQLQVHEQRALIAQLREQLAAATQNTGPAAVAVKQ